MDCPDQPWKPRRLYQAIWAAVVLCLLQACAAAPPSSEPEVALAGLTGPIELPFALDRGRIVLEATLNGREGELLSFDTGMTDSHMLTAEAAERLSLDLLPGGIGYDSAGRPFTLKVGTLDRIRMGGLLLVGEPVAVLAMPPEATRLANGHHLSGVLGDTLAHRYAVTLDFERRIIRLDSALPQAGEGPAIRLPLAWTGNLLSIPITVAGRQVLAMVDTGDFYTLTLFDDTAEDLGITPPPGTGMRIPVIGAAGPYVLEMAQADRVEIGALTLQDVPVAIGPRGEGLPTQIGARIGMGLLANFTVTLDARIGQLTLAERADQPFFAAAGILPLRQASEQ